MAPPAAGAARRAAAVPQSRPAARRPPLRVFEPEPRRSARGGLSRRGYLAVAVVLVVGSLLVVVVGDTMVAQGQVRLARIQSAIDAQLATQKSIQSEVAQLAAPVRVVSQGIHLGLTAPAQVVDLPQVPLDVPLPVPQTAPLPARATAHPATAAAAATKPTMTKTVAGPTSSTAPTTAAPAR